MFIQSYLKKIFGKLFFLKELLIFINYEYYLLAIRTYIITHGYNAFS